MNRKTNIVLAGVGGQGVITAANILGKAAIKEKIPVFVSEVHGMAQRGGSVNCTVRLGNVSGPLVASGTAHALIGLEPIETLRNISYTNKTTIIVTDINPVVPFTVSINSEKYPELDAVFHELERYGKVFKVDAVNLSAEAGSSITKNIVMLGALAAIDILPFKSQILLETILENVPATFKEINKKAFEGGMQAIK